MKRLERLLKMVWYFPKRPPIKNSPSNLTVTSHFDHRRPLSLIFEELIRPDTFVTSFISHSCLFSGCDSQTFFIPSDNLLWYVLLLYHSHQAVNVLLGILAKWALFKWLTFFGKSLLAFENSCACHNKLNFVSEILKNVFCYSDLNLKSRSPENPGLELIATPI